MCPCVNYCKYAHQLIYTINDRWVNQQTASCSVHSWQLLLTVTMPYRSYIFFIKLCTQTTPTNIMQTADNSTQMPNSTHGKCRQEIYLHCSLNQLEQQTLLAKVLHTAFSHKSSQMGYPGVQQLWTTLANENYGSVQGKRGSNWTTWWCPIILTALR